MEENEKKSNSLFKVVIILGILLAAAIVAIILTTTSMTKKVNEATLANEQLQLTNEQLQLANEYQALNTEYAQYENQSQLLANDSLVSKYAAAKSKVEKLLQELNSEKKKSAQRIKQLQDEIGTLKTYSAITSPRLTRSARRTRGCAPRWLKCVSRISSSPPASPPRLAATRSCRSA